MIQVLPGILEQDLSEIHKKVALVAPFVSWVHIDIADNTLVQNETFRNFEEWKDFPETLNFEAHLMVANPEKYLRPLVTAGFKRVIAHVEAQDPRHFLEAAQFEEIEVGLALDGPSNPEDLEPFLNDIDVVLLMGYEAGFSGQEFQLDTIEKIKAIHHAYPEAFMIIDGGMNSKTVPMVVGAGARGIVSTSYIFSHASTVGDVIGQLAQE